MWVEEPISYPYLVFCPLRKGLDSAQKMFSWDQRDSIKVKLFALQAANPGSILPITYGPLNTTRIPTNRPSNSPKNHLMQTLIPYSHPSSQNSVFDLRLHYLMTRMALLLVISNLGLTLVKIQGEVFTQESLSHSYCSKSSNSGFSSLFQPCHPTELVYLLLPLFLFTARSPSVNSWLLI